MFPMTSRATGLALAALLAALAPAQVHHHPNGQPWSQRAEEGPDAECPGWFYNLGVTGLRVALDDATPKDLIVRHVLRGAPAEGRVKVGDRIVGAGGARFETPHRNGYGMDVFGPTGPILDFAQALDEALDAKPRVLHLTILRGEEERDVEVPLSSASARLSPEFPLNPTADGKKFQRLCEYLLAEQRDDGSWGDPICDTFAPLALLSADKKPLRAAALKNAEWHARTTSTEDKRALVNWYYTSAGLVLAEAYAATKDKSFLTELTEVVTFLQGSQYLSLTQLSPTVKESHPHSWPTTAQQQHGGFGHKQGFEGYGPIAMVTGQAAAVYELARRAGVPVELSNIDAAQAFLSRGTGRNGYVWYGDEVADHDGWADMGRTGASALAARLGADRNPSLLGRARQHAAVMSTHPESFPDTHGSPLMGMGYAALGTLVDEAAFTRMVRANRWWFVLAECPDGTFAYQPNRDNAGYGSNARLEASATAAFIMALAHKRLLVTRD